MIILRPPSLVLIGLLFFACAGGEDPGEFEVFIGGENEVCDPSGSCGGEGIGQASLEISPSEGQLCYDLELEDIPDATGAHIHAGALGRRGPAVVDLRWPTGATASARCLEGLEAGVLADIVVHPRLYYLSVMSERFPDGAARGHLST